VLASPRWAAGRNIEKETRSRVVYSALHWAAGRNIEKETRSRVVCGASVTALGSWEKHREGDPV
jgi:hypothetical protein